MKTGVIISGIAHGVMVLLILLRLEWSPPPPSEVIEITEVTLMSSAEFDAALSNSPIMPDMDIAAMAQPVTDVNDATRPEDTLAPEVTEMDVTAAPTARDSNPDLSAVQRLAQPSVAVETTQPFTPDALPQVSPMVGLGTSGNSASPTFLSSPTPRTAPRIDSFSAPALPDDARVSDRTVEATAPDETATETVEEATAEALPESVTEIVPEAQPDVPPSAAPPRATRPPRRSANVERAAEAAAEAVRVAEEEAYQAARDAEEDAIRALLDAAELEAAAVEVPAVTLSGGQRQGIIEAVSRNWNKSIVMGKENYEQLVVTLAVQVAANGLIIGDVEPVNPASPAGDFLVAYDAARRSVLRAEVIPLPAGAYPEGVRLILTFNPAFDAAGLN